MSGSHEQSDRNRRAAERLAVLGDLRGEVMVFQPMAVRDLSPVGAQVETVFPLQIESLHDVRLALGDASLVVKARVTHCSIADVDQEFVSYRSGLEFVNCPARVLAVIERFVQAVNDSRREP